MTPTVRRRLARTGLAILVLLVFGVAIGHRCPDRLAGVPIVGQIVVTSSTSTVPR